MYRTLEKMLTQTDKQLERTNDEELSFAIIVKNQDTLDEILNIVRCVQKYSKDIYVIVDPEHQNIDEFYVNQSAEYTVILNERGWEILSAAYIEKSIGPILNDKIIFVDSAAECNNVKIEALATTNTSLAFFVNREGLIIRDMFIINKWSIKFFLRLLRLTSRSTFFDVLRIANEFVAILIDEKILLPDISEDLILTESKVIFPTVSVNYPVDIQDIVRVIALLSSIVDELVATQRIKSEYRFRQLLTFGLKFKNAGHYFLANVLLSFCYKYIERLEEPIHGWNKESIAKEIMECIKSEYRQMEDFKIEALKKDCEKKLALVNSLYTSPI